MLINSNSTSLEFKLRMDETVPLTGEQLTKAVPWGHFEITSSDRHPVQSYKES